MRSRAALLLVLWTSCEAAPAFADDAPLAPAVAVSKGAPAPEDGVFLTTARALDVAQRCREAQTERDMLRETLAADPGLSGLGTTVLVVAFAAGLVLGGGAVLLVKR